MPRVRHLFSYNFFARTTSAIHRDMSPLFSPSSSLLQIPTMQSKFQYFDRKGKPRPFLHRLMLHPSRIAAFVCLLLVIVFIRVHKPTLEGPHAAHRQVFESNSPSQKESGKIAIVTFTTDQKSYTHLSLKNHVRKSSLIPPTVEPYWNLIGLQTMLRSMATTSLLISSSMRRRVPCGISSK